MKISEVAKKLGISEATLRLGLREGMFPFGTAFRVSGKQFTYILYPEKVKEYIGAEMGEG